MCLGILRSAISDCILLKLGSAGKYVWRASDFCRTKCDKFLPVPLALLAEPLRDPAMTQQASSSSFAHHAIAVLLLLTLSPPLLSTSPSDHPPLAYAERSWGMQDGLPEQVVQAFAQTGDRYLWIGTTGGLLRFDGARFVLYNRENTPAFADNNIFCLMVSRDNTLWIGTEGGGLIRYRDGVFRAFSSADGLTNSFVRTVYQDHRGQIWIGTDSGLFRISEDRLERVDDSATLPLLAVHAIYEDSLGGLWVGGSRLVRLQGNESREFQLKGKASENRVKSIFQTADKTIWVGTVSGLHRLTPGAALSTQFERMPEVKQRCACCGKLQTERCGLAPSATGFTPIAMAIS